MDSPSGYKPDSTISDTELERQQQLMQEEYYLAKWNNSSSPKRPALDDRIHRILSDSPTHVANSTAAHGYQPEGYPYPMQHENLHNGMFYPELYHNNHQMPPPPVHLHPHPFLSQSLNHHVGSHDEFNNFSSPRNFVNNSNLVEITQQKRERQRTASSQAVQVGNVLEIVPSNKIVTPPETPKDQFDKFKPLSSEQIKQQAEKRMQAKLKRKVDRERKRTAKHTRKEKLRQEIQRYIEAGITAEVSDDENLIPFKAVNIAAAADRSIVKKTKSDVKSGKKVMFSDGVLPGETTSENDEVGNESTVVIKQHRRKLRKRRLKQLVKSKTINGFTDPKDTINDPELEKAPPPPPPADAPPPHLKQPRLKKVTLEMFAAFPVNPEPMYYYIQKMQQAAVTNGYHQVVPPPINVPRTNDRFHYYKKQPPPNVGQSPSYLQQQQPRSAIPKQPSSGKS